MVRIKKVYDKGFTVLDNASIDDTSLSWKAKGLFTYLWRQPDDWNFYAKEVAKHSKGGIHQVYTGLDELEKAGYLYRKRHRNGLGQLKDNDWQLSDIPKKEWMDIANKKKVPKRNFPDLDNPDQGKPDLENRTLPNTNSTKYLPNQVTTNTKSLSKERGENKDFIIEILINYINSYADQWHREPITFSRNELDKLKRALRGKDTTTLREIAEKAVVYGEQYPQGYLISCIKNLPEEKSSESSREYK